VCQQDLIARYASDKTHASLYSHPLSEKGGGGLMKEVFVNLG